MARAPDAARTSRSPSSSLPPSLRPPPLLRLTSAIRLRLYRYLELSSWDGSPYTFDLRGEQADYMPRRGGPNQPCFHGLLLACRAIYTEAAALLYSTNCFVVHYFPYSPAKPPGLQPLCALTSVSLRSLSNLKVVVNEAACHRLTPTDYLQVCCRHGRGNGSSSGLSYCQSQHSGAHRAPLLTSPLGGADRDENGGNEVVEANDAGCEWRSAAAHIFSGTTPNRLALSLVCDIEPQHPFALDLAESVVAPLYLLSRSHLRECRIRLAAVPNEQFHQVARNAALHACGLPASPQFSKQPPGAAATTLVSLPRELRFRILEYTDLVTPRRQVIWSREDHAYVVHMLQTRKNHSTADELYSGQFFQCWLEKAEGCFCGRRHAAFSLGCKCWVPPGPALFLLCRALSLDAQYVFFSRNRFIVQDYKASMPRSVPSPSRQHHFTVSREERDLPVSPPYRYPRHRFAISEFLREVVPSSALPHIRFLELAFPPYPPETWPGTEHPAMQDWRELLAWLQDKLNLAGLTLRVIVMNTSVVAPGPPLITTEEGAFMNGFKDFVRPLPRLAELGLARFYAHFPYPWRPAPPVSEVHRAHGPRWLWRERGSLKESLERYVMGGGYESLYADGKEEPVASDWGLTHLHGR